MLKILKKIYLQIIISIFGFFALTLPTLAAESIFDRMFGPAKRAIDAAYGGSQAVKVVGDPFLAGIFALLNALLTFTGIIFFLLLIYAGYLWLNAHGREEQVEKAKKITREVVIGLIIIVLARILTEFILIQIGNATNIPDQPAQ